MIFEARIERDWALICKGKFDECYTNALNAGFRVEGYVKRGSLLYNPRGDHWATITMETADTLPGLSPRISNWYFFEYKTKRPDEDDPREYMLRSF